MSRNSDRRDPATYVERGAARTRAGVGWGLGVPGALVVVLVALAVTASAWTWLPAAAVVSVVAFAGSYLVRVWPAAVTVDADGIRFGRVGAHARARVAPSMQAWGEFAATWSAVRSARVVDDVRPWRADTRALARSARAPSVGFFAPRPGVVAGRVLPRGSRAALVVELHSGATVEAPTFTPVRGQGVTTSSTWVVATRRPAALRSALARFDPVNPADRAAGT